jgi:serine protease AprX
MLRRCTVLFALVAVVSPAFVATATAADARKLDSTLALRAQFPRGSSRVIVQTVSGLEADTEIRQVGGQPGRRLPILGAQLATIPDIELQHLAAFPNIRALSFDRPIAGTVDHVSGTVGASWVRQKLGFDGAGVGVAIIDSGVTQWHDDLGTDRVVRFVDFVAFHRTAYDDYGHGTHVAGIIAGSGFDSNGARKGIAPGATLVVLKALDDSGNGQISNVIAALDYAISHRRELNIRVINLSVAAGVYESYLSDPLTLAARRAVEAGIVVVTAAGNLGAGIKGDPQYGGITAPGNAPWVLTVGASDQRGTSSRTDDVMAGFSSRGPTQIDRAVKPDVVAPGVGIESLGDADSVLFAAHPADRLWGTVSTVSQPYLRLTGTSMAAPVVTGTIALMLQANPGLTPNLVKAILQYTAESHSRYDALTEGAGFLNARGAVQLAQSLAGQPAGAKDPTAWGKQIIWGKHRVGGDVMKTAAKAWGLDVAWGSDTTPAGEDLVTAALCPDPTACSDVTWDEVDASDYESPWSAADAAAELAFAASLPPGHVTDPTERPPAILPSRLRAAVVAE